MKAQKRKSRFYTELYSVDPDTYNFNKDREQALRLIHSRIRDEDNTLMERTPTIEEVLKVINEMPKEKSPGIDGVTIEVLVKCWSFMGTACFDMVTAFWKDGTMTTKALARVIKLVPKSNETMELSNWRPLTML